MNKTLSIIFAVCGIILIVQKSVFAFRLFNVGTVSIGMAIIWVLSIFLIAALCIYAAKTLWTGQAALTSAWRKTLWAALCVSTFSHLLMLPINMPKSGYMSFQPPGEFLVWIVTSIVLPLAIALFVLSQSPTFSETAEDIFG